MKNYALFIFASLLIGLSACKKDNDLTEPVQHDVLSVGGPAAGTVNTPVTLTVTYPYSNGCDYVGAFEESRSGTNITIKALSKPVAKNAVCTQDAGTRTIDYQFSSSTTGTFVLQFIRTNGSPVNHTIVIQ
jgi:hypothetical protein